MFDPWGVGEAMRSVMRMYTHAKRATGRTTLLLACVQDKDTIVTVTHAEGQRLKALAKAQGKDVFIIAYDPREDLIRQYEYIMQRWNRKGKLWFDHMWFEGYFFYAIEQAMSDLDKFSEALDREEAGRVARENELRQTQWDPTDAVRAIGGI